MNVSNTTSAALTITSSEMKHDWNKRAQENAKWFINTLKIEQTEEEFDLTGRRDFQGLIWCELPLLTGRRHPKTLRVLEIGCGIGRMTKYLAEVFGEVHAIDVSGEMIRQAKERLANTSNVHFSEGNGSDFSSFPDEYFDFVFSAYVFQHVPSFEVIKSNICDAFRVLKPRGIFKFVTSGVNNEDYLKADKDTWSGHPFTEQDIRPLAKSLGAQLLGVVGNGTQYCWTLLRKHAGAPAEVLSADRQPRIKAVGRADNPTNPELAPRNGAMYLSITVDGMIWEELDATNLMIEVNGRTMIPCYVGPVGIPVEHLPQITELYPEDAYQTQINFLLPADEPAGEASLCVIFPEGRRSNIIAVKLPAITSPPPRILAVTNNADSGLDIFASGPKSQVRILADQLEPGTTAEDVAIKINDSWVKPERVVFVPGNVFWEITAQLPSNLTPGETSLQVQVKGLLSLPAAILVQETLRK